MRAIRALFAPVMWWLVRVGGFPQLPAPWPFAERPAQSL
jgi:hypothetical protein